jgi:hypothetical protein
MSEKCVLISLTKNWAIFILIETSDNYLNTSQEVFTAWIIFPGFGNAFCFVILVYLVALMVISGPNWWKLGT